MEGDFLARVRSDVFDGLHPADADPRPFVRGFERIEVIGTGSFGTVWRARDRALDKEVALKVLKRTGSAGREEVERFLREARILASIDHPNVLRIHSIDEQEGEIVMSLELVSGRTLENLVRSAGPLSAHEAAQIGIELCKALAAIHARGLIHGDIKHANVMRAEGGRIVLLDFGLSRFVSGASSSETPASPRGTPLFMAPEAFDAPASVDQRTDLYSLGVLLYWLVAAAYPVQAKNLQEIRARLRDRQSIPLRDRRSDLPNGFVRIVQRLLHHEPAQRLSSAGAAEAELAGFLEGRERRDSEPIDRRRPTIRTLLLAGCGALALILGVFALQHGQEARGGEGAKAKLARLFVLRGAERVELEENATVSRGEPLVIEVTTARDAYLYLLDEDLDGGVKLLFPRDGCALENPVQAGKTVELPGACGAEPAYRLEESTRAGGRDRLLLVESPAPLAWISPEVQRERARRSGYERARLEGGEETPGLEPFNPLATELERLSPFLASVAKRLQGTPGVVLERWEIVAR